MFISKNRGMSDPATAGQLLLILAAAVFVRVFYQFASSVPCEVSSWYCNYSRNDQPNNCLPRESILQTSLQYEPTRLILANKARTILGSVPDLYTIY